MKALSELGISKTPWHKYETKYSVCVDDCNSRIVHYSVIGFEHGIANARLIAAAPELYECLRKLYELEFPMGYEGVSGEWLTIAKATEKALAKASGEEVAL